MCHTCGTTEAPTLAVYSHNPGGLVSCNQTCDVSPFMQNNASRVWWCVAPMDTKLALVYFFLLTAISAGWLWILYTSPFVCVWINPSWNHTTEGAWPTSYFWHPSVRTGGSKWARCVKNYHRFQKFETIFLLYFLENISCGCVFLWLYDRPMSIKGICHAVNHKS